MIHEIDIENYKILNIENLKRRGWKELCITGLYSDEKGGYCIITLGKEFDCDKKEFNEEEISNLCPYYYDSKKQKNLNDY